MRCIRLPERYKERVKAEKLAPRAMKGQLVGWQDNAGGIYRIWLPEKNKVVKVRDVRFNEKAPHQPGKQLPIGVEGVCEIPEEIPEDQLATIEYIFPQFEKSAEYKEEKMVNEPTNNKGENDEDIDNMIAEQLQLEDSHTTTALPGSFPAVQSPPPGPPVPPTLPAENCPLRRSKRGDHRIIKDSYANINKGAHTFIATHIKLSYAQVDIEVLVPKLMAMVAYEINASPKNFKIPTS